MNAAALFPYKMGESQAMASAWLYSSIAWVNCWFLKTSLARSLMASTAGDRGLLTGRYLQPGWAKLNTAVNLQCTIAKWPRLFSFLATHWDWLTPLYEMVLCMHGSGCCSLTISPSDSLFRLAPVLNAACSIFLPKTNISRHHSGRCGRSGGQVLADTTGDATGSGPTTVHGEAIGVCWARCLWNRSDR